MTKLNSELFAILKHAGSPVLTTAFYLVANSLTGQMQYSNAGHPKPLLVRRSAKTVEQLKSKSKKSQPALGLFEKSAYETSEIKLAAKDLLMLFTDGLYEVHSAKDEIYSQERMTTSVTSQLHLPAAQLFDSILKEIREFSAHHAFDDDLCLVGMEYTGTPHDNVR
jgi:sigma-B regulation protein RsbU (phosphoserine phosphatase)